MNPVPLHSLSSPMARRRKLLAACMLLAAGLGPAAALAQDYPSRPVKLIVPFGPGTTTDIISRVFAEALAKPLGQTVVVENRAGAGGVIGSDLVAKSPADGYTLVMGTVGTHAINASLYKKLPYDPLKDFAPVAFAGYTPTLLVVAANSPLKSVKDLGAQAGKPGGVSFASAGNGTSGHLAGELLKARLGGEMVHVPYKEGGLAMSDVMAGQVQFMFYHPAAVLPHIKAGKLRPLAVTTATRSPALPDVPTLDEAGLKGFNIGTWFGVLAPVATPKDIQARLSSEMVKIIKSPEFRQRMADIGADPIGDSQEQMAQTIKAETEKFGKLVKDANVVIE